MLNVQPTPAQPLLWGCVLAVTTSSALASVFVSAFASLQRFSQLMCDQQRPASRLKRQLSAVANLAARLATQCATSQLQCAPCSCELCICLKHLFALPRLLRLSPFTSQPQCASCGCDCRQLPALHLLAAHAHATASPIHLDHPSPPYNGFAAAALVAAAMGLES